MNEKTLLNEIFHKIKELNSQEDQNDFIPGNSYIPYSGRVYDEKEKKSLVDSALNYWLTSGRFFNRLKPNLLSF